MLGPTGIDGPTLATVGGDQLASNSVQSTIHSVFSRGSNKALKGFREKRH